MNIKGYSTRIAGVLARHDMSGAIRRTTLQGWSTWTHLLTARARSAPPSPLPPSSRAVSQRLALQGRNKFAPLDKRSAWGVVHLGQSGDWTPGLPWPLTAPATCWSGCSSKHRPIVQACLLVCCSLQVGFQQLENLSGKYEHCRIPEHHMPALAQSRKLRLPCCRSQDIHVYLHPLAPFPHSTAHVP